MQKSKSNIFCSFTQENRRIMRVFVFETATQANRMIKGKDVVIWTNKGQTNIQKVVEVQSINGKNLLIVGSNGGEVLCGHSIMMSIQTEKSFGRKAKMENRRLTFHKPEKYQKKD